MPTAPARYQDKLCHLKRYAESLHAEIESGAFYRRSWVQRRKMIARVRRLYGQLLGPIGAPLLRATIATAGALALAACNPLTDPPDGGGTQNPPPDPSQTLGDPNFSAVQLNPFGLDPADWSQSANGSFQMAGTTLAAADIDGDGDLDLVAAGVSTSPAGLLFFRNSGTPGSPAFDAPQAEPFGLSLTGGVDTTYYDPLSYFTTGFVRDYTVRGLAFADLDSDGDLDLVGTGTYDYYDYDSYLFGGPFPRVFAAENTGSATAPEFQGLYQISGLGSNDYYTFGQIAVLDLDGDLAPDLLYSTSEDTLQSFNETDLEFAMSYGTAVTSLSGVQQLSFVSLDGKAFSTGDLDGDGDPDLLARGYGDSQADNEFRFSENTGSAGSPVWAAAVTDPFGLSIGADDTVFRPLVADLDADGDQDVIALLWRESSPGNFDLYAAFWENTDIQ